MTRAQRIELAHLAGAITAIALVTWLYITGLRVSNAATASTTFLLIVLVVAATTRLWAAVVASVAAMLFLNLFFLPPFGTLTIADPQNWVALFVFLAVSLIASNLSAVARSRTGEALSRRDELARLFDLSRDILVITDSREALTVLARAIARRFDLEFVALALPRGDDWDIFEAGSSTFPLDTGELTHAFATAQASIDFDAYARTYAGHRAMVVAETTIRLVPLRVGTRPIGLLAAAGRPVEAGTLDTLAGVVALAIERTQFLEERKAAELTRQSEELKTALLASLGHDLRTPLTAIRIAAGNLQASSLSPDDRVGQIDLILAETERLARLFQNILEMARIDAGAVATEARWVHPSEIIAAARIHVEQTLRRHSLDIAVEPEVPVHLDPRLTATALAHVLENAAQYAPIGTTIHVTATVSVADGLTIQVRDHGRGIAAADMTHLFERFYRGDTGRIRVSGTGVGLSIARGLLAVQKGRIWADNHPDGGAQFTLVVPCTTRPPEAEASLT